MESNTSFEFGAFIPLILMILVWASTIIPIANRKGKSQLKVLLMILIPFYGWWYYTRYITSLPDKAVLDRLEVIEKHLGIQKRSNLASAIGRELRNT